MYLRRRPFLAVQMLLDCTMGAPCADEKWEQEDEKYELKPDVRKRMAREGEGEI